MSFGVVTLTLAACLASCGPSPTDRPQQERPQAPKLPPDVIHVLEITGSADAAAGWENGDRHLSGKQRRFGASPHFPGSATPSDASQRLLAAPVASRPRAIVADSDGALHLPAGDAEVTFARVYCTSPQQRDAVLIAETDGAIRAWCNGQTILLEESPDAGAAAHWETEFELPAGASRLEFAFAGGSGRMKLRLVDADGAGMADVLLDTAQPAELAPQAAEPAQVGRDWLDHGDPRYRFEPTLIFTGEVTAISRPPSPFAIAPYTECLMLVEYKVIEAEAGECSPGEAVLVALWGIKASRPTAEAAFRPGQRHRVECDPFDNHEALDGYPMANDIEGSLDRDWFMCLRWTDSTTETQENGDWLRSGAVCR